MIDITERRHPASTAAACASARPADLRREIGYVIQQIGLFPHLTIGDNIATVPRLLGWDKRAHPRPRGGAARPDRPARRRWRDRYPGAALRRPAPARRRGPRARRRPAADADGRAVRRDRPDQPRAAAERVPAPAGGDPQDDRLRHPRHRRGDQDGRPDRDHAGRAATSPSTPRRPSCWLRPANAFVEDFVGADRALKRLSLQRVRDVDLWQAPPCGWASRWPRRARQVEAADVPTPLLVDERGAPLGWLSERALTGDTVSDELRVDPEPVVERDDVLRDALSDLLAHELDVRRRWWTTRASSRACSRSSCWPTLTARGGSRVIDAPRPAADPRPRTARVVRGATTASVRAGSSDNFDRYETPLLAAHRAHRAVGGDRLRDRVRRSRCSRTAGAGWCAPITQITGILYTIPSVAMFFLLLPLTGRGTVTALIALVAYTLLIIFRNVITGLEGVPGGGARRRPRDGPDREPAAVEGRAAAGAAGDHGRAADRDHDDGRPGRAGRLRRRRRAGRARSSRTSTSAPTSSWPAACACCWPSSSTCSCSACSARSPPGRGRRDMTPPLRLPGRLRRRGRLHLPLARSRAARRAGRRRATTCRCWDAPRAVRGRRWALALRDRAAARAACSATPAAARSWPSRISNIGRAVPSIALIAFFFAFLPRRRTSPP